MNRRNFLHLASLAAGTALFQSSRGQDAPKRNEKLGIGMIGLGGQGRSRLSEILLCGGSITTLCDVDEHALGQAKALLSQANHPLPETYLDYRELLNSGVEGVVIATPDHSHAPISTAALKAGKHVFCEKPLTHTISEARDLRNLSGQYPHLSTQMGNQGSASLFMRRGIEIVQAGGIGTVREFHVWVPPSQSFKAGQTAPTGADPLPGGLSWDHWIGVAPFRPYKKGEYHPRAWRAWYDFGGGSIADWGCHGLNFPYRSLRLDYPNRVTPDIPGAYTDGYPKQVRLRYDFPSRGELAPVIGWWYDGGRQPDSAVIPKSLIEHQGKMPDEGCLLLGDKGFTYGNAHACAEYIQLWTEPKLSGITNHKASASIPVSLPRAHGHMQEWITACGGGPPTFSNFEIGGHLTEIVLAGVVAVRAQKQLDWNGPEMRAENDPTAVPYIHAEYRKGWI